MRTKMSFACRSCGWALFGVLGLVLGAGGAEGLPAVDWGRDRKKVVSFGWEWSAIQTDDILKYADQIDATGVDGISLYVRGYRKDGSKTWSAAVIDGHEWTYDMVEGQEEAMRQATRHRGLRECFISAIHAPTKRLDWKDDAHWAKVARSMAVLARFAKRTGIRGFIVDPEDYHHQNQFEARPEDEPYDVLAPYARKRGREIFAAVFREYPEAVVFGYWLFSWHVAHISSENPMRSARTAGDLWPAFVNGILDVLPPTARMVDGNEWAYEDEAKDNEFMISATVQRNAVRGLVAPENRGKFRAQYEPGFGLYLDSYTNPKTDEKGKPNHYCFGAENGSRLGHLERNLGEALNCAGEYVWLWCESYSWVKWGADVKVHGNVDRRLWNECLPGLNAMLRAATDPDEFFARDFKALKESGRIVNIATNDYIAASAEALGSDHDPKDEKQKGKGYFHVVDTSARPGMHYVLAAEGSGEGLEAVAFWQRRSNGWWRWRVPGHGLALRKGADGKSRGKAIVRVPEGVDCLAVQFRLHPPKGKTCAFEKIFLGRIDFSDRK